MRALICFAVLATSSLLAAPTPPTPQEAADLIARTELIKIAFDHRDIKTVMAMPPVHL